jgi:hypothetical protein
MKRRLRQSGVGARIIMLWLVAVLTHRVVLRQLGPISGQRDIGAYDAYCGGYGATKAILPQFDGTVFIADCVCSSGRGPTNRTAPKPKGEQGHAFLSTSVQSVQVICSSSSWQAPAAPVGCFVVVSSYNGTTQPPNP